MKFVIFAILATVSLAFSKRVGNALLRVTGGEVHRTTFKSSILRTPAALGLLLGLTLPMLAFRVAVGATQSKEPVILLIAALLYVVVLFYSRLRFRWFFLGFSLATLGWLLVVIYVFIGLLWLAEF